LAEVREEEQGISVAGLSGHQEQGRARAEQRDEEVGEGVPPGLGLLLVLAIE
jgi:hypothetical protein